MHDTTITVRDSFLISVPKKYITRASKGDDTEFLDVRDPEGHLVLGYESGVNEVAEIKNPENLHSGYEIVDSLKSTNLGIIWIAYNTTTNKLRNRTGKVFIERKGNLSEIMRFSCGAEYVGKIKELLKTLRYKI